MSGLSNKTLKIYFLKWHFALKQSKFCPNVKNTWNIVVLLFSCQSLARSEADRSSPSADNAKKVFVLNASERIRKIEGNSYCADCSAPSKF